MNKDGYARAIITEGQRRGITVRGIEIAVATALVESNLVMYANEADPDSLNYPHDALSTDSNSVGLFQQRAPWWGTVADRMDPARSAGLFYAALVKLDYNGPNSPGSYAQSVQDSKYPDRYDQRFGDASTLYDRLVNAVAGPQYRELDYLTGGGRSNRSRPPTNWLLHTEEGGSSAEQLARYCDGSHDVSYHYTLRDAVLCDVVDTDYASWSVLDANAYTINLCFAGSRVAMSRDEWLTRSGDIEIAAYIAVQDCHKYNIPTVVIPPPYRVTPGISDHKYVTQALHIGTHIDVGDNFPWDVFTGYVNKYANGQPTANDSVEAVMATNQEKLDLIYDKLAAYPGVSSIAGKWQSRARCRRDNKGVDDTVGMVLYEDANLYDLLIAWSAVAVGDPFSVETIKLGAAGKLPANDAGSVSWFKAVESKLM